MAVSFHPGYGIIKTTLTCHYPPSVSGKVRLGDYRHFLVPHTKKINREESSSGEINPHPMTPVSRSNLSRVIAPPQRCVVSAYDRV